jgi:hypothetical protein
MRTTSKPLRALAALCTAAVALLGPVAAAHAEDDAHEILRRCGHAESIAGFPPSAYAKALKDISATTEEYSECGQLIREAEAAAAQGHGRSGGAVGTAGAQPLAATPAEQRELASAVTAGGAPISLGGQAIHPGVVHADVASAFSTMPTPLLALIAFVLACLLALAARIVQKRVRGRRAD